MKKKLKLYYTTSDGVTRLFFKNGYFFGKCVDTYVYHLVDTVNNGGTTILFPSEDNDLIKVIRDADGAGLMYVESPCYPYLKQILDSTWEVSPLPKDFKVLRKVKHTAYHRIKDDKLQLLSKAVKILKPKAFPKFLYYAFNKEMWNPVSPDGSSLGLLDIVTIDCPLDEMLHELGHMTPTIPFEEQKVECKGDCANCKCTIIDRLTTEEVEAPVKEVEVVQKLKLEIEARDKQIRDLSATLISIAEDGNGKDTTIKNLREFLRQQEELAARIVEEKDAIRNEFLEKAKKYEELGRQYLAFENTMVDVLSMLLFQHKAKQRFQMPLTRLTHEMKEKIKVRTGELLYNFLPTEE